MSKVWLVTGAARGLGRAICEAALIRGDRVVAGARDTAKLSDLHQRFASNLSTVTLDVRNEREAAEAAQLAHHTFGSLDVLVNNAGYGHTIPFEQMTAADFRDQIETNLFGVVNLTRAAIPFMRRQRHGHIFQVSSVGGRVSTPGLSAYQAAKWAVGGFSDIVAKEAAPFGVRVCTLEPGGMRTDWSTEAKKGVENMLPDYEPSVGKVLELLRQYGGQEVGDPAKIASLIVDLSRRDDVPMRLLLGSDAVFVCKEAETQRAEDLQKWLETSLSIHFGDSELPAGLSQLR